MTGQELIDVFKRHIDDAPDDETILDLINIVKDLVEGSKPWRMLIKEDTSNTFESGNTYLTAKSLPSDFMYEMKVLLGIESNDDYSEYLPVAFEERRRLKDSQKYSIDTASKEMYILGNVDRTYTIYLYYIYETDPIELATSPVWPVKYQRIIPLLAAELWKSGIDTDVFNLEQALALSKPGNILFRSMRDWDATLKIKSMNNMAPIHGSRDGEITGVVNDPDNLL